MRYVFLTISVTALLMAYFTRSQGEMCQYFLLGAVMNVIMAALWPKIEESVKDDELQK
jgi:hypothetical protein